MRVDRALAALLPFVVGASMAACSWDLGKIFDRNDPAVEQARHELEASTADGDADLVAARLALEELLKFRCEGDGGVDLVVKLPGASLDLGLLVFRVSELLGQRFGDEELEAGEAQETIAANRGRELDCAQRLLMRLAGDPSTPRELALRARYLLGNFAFLARRYKDAIARYDEVLVAHPARGNDPRGEIGAPGDDDAVARDAAWNRAIALKRLEDEKKDSGDDADSDAPDTQDTAPETDSGSDGNDADSGSDSADSGNDGGADSGRDSQSEAGDGGDSGGGHDAARDGGEDAGADAAKPPPPQPKPAPTSSAGADLSELDRFEKKAPLNPDKPAKPLIPVPKGYDK
jgi:hypothetical protein